MPYVEITQTVPVAGDGIHVRKFSKGWKGTVTEAEANILKNIGAAKEIKEPVAPVSRRAEPKKEENKPPEPKVNKSPKPEETKVPEKPKEDKVEKMKVSEMADEYGTSSKKILDVCKKLDICATTIDSGLSEDEINRIKKELNLKDK